MAEIVLDRVSKVDPGGVKGVDDLGLDQRRRVHGLQQGKTPKAEITRRVNDVARMPGIGEYLKRKPAALSGGQRQRVARSGRAAGVQRPTSDRAMTSRWIWFVPSTICSTLASRRYRSAGKSSTYP